MKKIILVGIGIFSLFCLAGCNIGTQTLTCTITETENDVATTQIMTSTFKDGKLSKVNVSLEMILGEMYDGYVETAKQSVDQQFAELENAEGVTYDSSMNLEEKKISVHVKADMATMDENTKILLNIQDANMDETYKEAKTNFESNGYTCQ